MKHLIFTLTMPHVNTWNGRWSGEDKNHVKVKSMRNEDYKKLPDIVGHSFHHRWKDGWCACVSVALAENAKEANRIARNSDGFMGYEWMISSLLQFGKILYENDWPVVGTNGA